MVTLNQIEEIEKITSKIVDPTKTIRTAINLFDLCPEKGTYLNVKETLKEKGIC